jgi:uncharacterized protein HemY
VIQPKDAWTRSPRRTFSGAALPRAEQLEREPLAQARMLEALGRVYASRGDFPSASKLLERALVVTSRTLRR